MGTCVSVNKSLTDPSKKTKKKKLVQSSIMVIPVNNPPETTEENDGFSENPSSSSPSTRTISESPINENLVLATTPTVVNGVTRVKSRWSFSSSRKSYGSSRDETFFDTNPWLPSDSEDDFFSVNGDFTPSRGNTPKCSFSAERLPQFKSPLLDVEKPRVSFSLSPAPRRKKLGELFRDSIREERAVIFEDLPEYEGEKSKKTLDDYSSELKVIEDLVEGEKDLKSLSFHHRCLPRFPSFKGGLLMEKRKKKKKKKIHVK